MKKNNHMITTGLFLSFLALGLSAAQASSPHSENLGEFFTISAQSKGRVYFSLDDGSGIPAIYEKSREMLIEKAAEACSGRHFSIDEASIEQTDTRRGAWGDFMIVTVTSTARVFCIN